jgi:4-phosphopantoate--beta-alanine ligase
MGKKVLAIDLNPLSRTAQQADITIVDNIARAMPSLVITAKKLKTENKEKLRAISSDFDNKRSLSKAIALINQRLAELAESGKHISILEPSKT